MRKHILVLNGHPDPGKGHLGDALVAAYMAGAVKAGHEVDILNIAELDFELLRSKEAWETSPPCGDITAAQLRISRAEHILLFYPLWLGEMPALVKGFLEQVLRPGFAFPALGGAGIPKKGLAGKTARVIVTMGMPAFIYRWFYGAHSLKSLKRNILAFCGISPVRSTLVGLVESKNPKGREKALQTLEELGRAAA